jgi:hypothetical protein
MNRIKLVVDVSIPDNASIDGLEDAIMLFVDSLRAPSYETHSVHRLSPKDLESEDRE